VADAVMFRPLPVEAPGELHAYAARLRLGAAEKHFGGVTDEAFAAIAADTAIGAAGGFRQAGDVRLEVGAAPRTVNAELVSPEYFSVLGVRPAAGRMLSAAESLAGPLPVVVSGRIAIAVFGGSAAAVSAPVRVNGLPAVIVGVTGPFRGMAADRPADLFAPLGAAGAIDPAVHTRQIRLFLRLPRDSSPEVAADRLRARLVASGPSMLRDGELRVALDDASRGMSDDRSKLSRPLWVGLGLAAVLLLVACANTGGLLLGRLAARRGEFAVRIAIGAGRGRLIRQLVVEALLIAALAAAASVLAAGLAAPALLRAVPNDTRPLAFDLRLDWRLAAFTGVVSMLAMLLAAGASLARLGRTAPAWILAGESRAVTRGRHRVTHALVGAQVASVLLLLAGAGAMTRSLVNLARVDPGFDAARIIMATVEASPRPLDPGALRAWFAALCERLAGAPGIRRAAVVQAAPMSGSATTGTVEVPGFVPAADEDRWVRLFWVGAGFFETTGMRLRQGDGLTAGHMAGGGRVAVVNERFARFYFGSAGGAVGRVVNRDVRIIGVVADAHYDTLRDEPARAMFIPFTQAPARQEMTIVAQPAESEAQAIAAAAAAIRAFDPRARFAIVSGTDRVAATFARERFVGALAVVATLLALALAAAGLYATVAYSVSERRGELAVRIALGATGRDIVRLVLRDPLRTALLGIAAGAPGAWALSRVLATLLFGVPRFDLATLVPGAAALVAIMTLAALPAARRAARIDPQACLKCP
jgi:predicted permease